MRSKKALYNIVTNLLLQIIIVIYGFIVPKIIISNFGSNVNGLISSITQFLGYIVLLESGFGPVVKSMLYKPIAQRDKKEIASILRASSRFFKKIAIIFILYIVILVIIYPLLVNNEFDSIYTITLLLIISISTFAEYFFGMTYKLYLQAEQKTYVTSLIQIITYILSIVLIILLVKVNVSVHIIKLTTALVFILRPILQNVYVKKKYSIDLNLGEKNYKIEKKWDGLAQHVAYVIHSNTDVTILTIFCNLAEVSVYSVYYMIVNGIKSIIQAFSNGIDASFGDMLAKEENEKLNKSFDLYEIMYNSICTIIYSCTFVLIVPFVSIYTKDIFDVNYVRYIFGFFIVLGEYIWAIRLPYSTLTLAAGHFKETRKGALLEAGSNIVISLILVGKYGIIGVVIGTSFAMFIRTIEFIYHVNKYILKRSIFLSIKKIILIIIETGIILVSCNYFIHFDELTYFRWIITAVIVFLYSCIITIGINAIFYHKSYREVIEIGKNILKRKKK